MMDIESLKKYIIRQNYDLDLFTFYPPPAIFTTAEFSAPDLRLNYQNGVSIETWVTFHLSFILVVSFLGAIAINVNTSSPQIHFLIAFPGLFVILYLLYKSIKSLHSRIIIDFEGMVIKKRRFDWTGIFQTFIIDEANGRRWTKGPAAFFLIVVGNDGEISKFEITYLGTSPQKLAGIIEYFKTGHKDPTR